MSKQDDSSGPMVSVMIPSSLADKIKKRIADDGFLSVPDYVTHVLRQQIDISEKNMIHDVDHNIDQIKRRLKTLGYLD